MSEPLRDQLDDTQRLLQAVVAQRDAATNQVADLHARLMKATARIQELEEQQQKPQKPPKPSKPVAVAE